MTREERLAAGWTLSGWAVKGRANGKEPIWAMGPYPTLIPPYISACKSDRRVFPVRQAAMKEAATWSDNWEAKLVQIWRRKKAPAPLKVGDEVLVRGLVAVVDPPGSALPYKVAIRNSHIWVERDWVTRAKPPRPMVGAARGKQAP